MPADGPRSISSSSSPLLAATLAAGVDLVRLVRRGLPVGAGQFVLDSGSLTVVFPWRLQFTVTGCPKGETAR
jgi:hypothetical protein